MDICGFVDLRIYLWIYLWIWICGYGFVDCTFDYRILRDGFITVNGFICGFLWSVILGIQGGQLYRGLFIFIVIIDGCRLCVYNAKQNGMHANWLASKW
jgi:hypothetical protein